MSGDILFKAYTNTEFSRRISTGLMASVILLAVTVATATLWMAKHQNDVAADHTKRMVAGGIENQLDLLDAIILDYSHWTAAYDAILSGDEEWLFENIGIATVDAGPMNSIILIRPHGAGRYVWTMESDEYPYSGLADGGGLVSVLAMLDDLPVGRRETISAYTSSNGGVWVVSAARVEFSEETPPGATDADLPRQIHGILVSDDLLSEIGNQYLIEDLTLATEPVTGKASLALDGPDGSPVAYLVWTPPTPGWVALRDISLPLILVVIIAGLGVAFATRYILNSAGRLERALIGAQAANRSKAEFIGGLSHELRTPLNGVIGLAQVLLMGNTLGDEEREMVDVIYRSGMTQIGMIEDLLDASQFDAGQRILDTEPFDPVAALADVCSLARPSAEAKGLGFEVSLPDGPSMLILGDRSAFMQICTNLVGNSVKFTDEGSVSASLSITVISGEAALELRVADTGPGIDPAMHQKIFERFCQVDSALTRKAGGTGLGLAITKSLIDLMGGTIRLDSAPGQGSAFAVSLKAEITDANELSQVA